VTILDAHLPDMDGIAVAQAIKSDPALADIHVILLTPIGCGKSDEAQQAGFAAYLPKPIRQLQLYECLARVLGNASALSATQATTRPILRNAPAPISGCILVVEDNAVNQKVAVRLLEKLGCRVDVAANGREALAMLSQLAYHVVLMDCQMPEMDGFAATAAIRQLELSTGRHVPIIAMTANAMQGDRERCLAAGMDGYLSKPMRADDLYAVIDQFRPEGPALPEDSLAPPIDLVAALIAADGARELLQELMQVLLSEYPGQLVTLRAALEHSDACSLERTAHSLKGALGTVGAVRAQVLAQELEATGSADQMENAPSLVQQLDAELTRLAAFWAQASEAEQAPVVSI
jgi:CheY-like chemotaxis protein